MANGRSLDHVFISQKIGKSLGISKEITNGGWNLIVMPGKWNGFIGGVALKGMRKTLLIKSAMITGRVGSTALPLIVGAAAGAHGYIAGTLAQDTAKECECK